MQEDLLMLEGKKERSRVDDIIDQFFKGIPISRDNSTAFILESVNDRVLVILASIAKSLLSSYCNHLSNNCVIAIKLDNYCLHMLGVYPDAYSSLGYYKKKLISIDRKLIEYENTYIDYKVVD